MHKGGTDHAHELALSCNPYKRDGILTCVGHVVFIEGHTRPKTRLGDVGSVYFAKGTGAPRLAAQYVHRVSSQLYQRSERLSGLTWVGSQ